MLEVETLQARGSIFSQCGSRNSNEIVSELAYMIGDAFFNRAQLDIGLESSFAGYQIDCCSKTY